MVAGSVSELSEKRFELLVEALVAADQAAADEETHRWRSAEMIAGLLAEEVNGKKVWSARRLAAELEARGYRKLDGEKMSYWAVSMYDRIWRRFGVCRGTQSFADAFALVKAGASEEEVEEVMEEAAATGKAPSTVVTRNRELRARAGALPVQTGSARVAILNLIAEAAARGEGQTDDDLCAAAGKVSRGASSSVRSARDDLVKLGWVVDAGETKLSPLTGKPVTVWFLSEEGAIQFNLGRGWKAKRKVRSRGGSGKGGNGGSGRSRLKPQAETPDERRQRLEREAIKRAEEEFTENLQGANLYRAALKKIRELAGIYLQLEDTLERYPCPLSAQETLIELLEFHSERANSAAEALRKHQPAPVDMRYYEVLGVPVEATATAIKKVYRDLARKYHPDANGGDETKFKEIAHAYAVLGDPERRRLYNMYGGDAK